MSASLCVVNSTHSLGWTWLPTGIFLGVAVRVLLNRWSVQQVTLPNMHGHHTSHNTCLGSTDCRSSSAWSLKPSFLVIWLAFHSRGLSSAPRHSWTCSSSCTALFPCAETFRARPCCFPGKHSIQRGTVENGTSWEGAAQNFSSSWWLQEL